MKKIFVLMGGISSEREISLLSGAGVVTALKEKGYEVVQYDLSENINDFIQLLENEKPDIVFNALHGKYGEDGCIQGLLNLLKIPYTHSGVLSSSISMNKEITKRYVSGQGVLVPRGGLMTKSYFLESGEPDMPYVIKPNDEGSSAGVFIVRSKQDRELALSKWPENESRLVESYIPGRELSVAVLNGKSIGVVEIIPKSGYYDFKNKYTTGLTTHIIPAAIPAEIYQKAMEQAEKIHQCLGCRGVSRIDFRLDDVSDSLHPKLFFLELNANPGMTTLSLVPELAKVCLGIEYADLVDLLVQEAQCDR